MVNEGLRNKPLEIDRSCFKKSLEEREELKKRKKNLLPFKNKLYLEFKVGSTGFPNN